MSATVELDFEPPVGGRELDPPVRLDVITTETTRDLLVDRPILVRLHGRGIGSGTGGRGR